MVSRAGLDPVSDRLMKNMFSYMTQKSGHHIHPLIDAPIRWGEYETEKGVLTGIYSGLMLNPHPRLTGKYKNLPLLITKEGHQIAERFGGWNNRAGLQYIPFGRRPFGPYFHRGFGGIPEPESPYNQTGTAMFWCRVPGETSSMKTLCWNPTQNILNIKISVNNEVTSRKIDPGSYKSILNKFSLNSQGNKIEIVSDRRMVILETAFD